MREDQMRVNNSYGTQTEINFITGLGTGAFATRSWRVKLMKRSRALRKYIEAATVRDIWYAVDKTRCINYAQGLLGSVKK